jgi:hypothetical protein
MNLDSDDEFEEPEWAPRPVVLPTFKIPTGLAAPVGWGLVAAATLAVIAALVRAVSYRVPAPSGSGLLGPGENFFQPSFGFADRISLFATGAAGLTVALLVVIAVVVTAMTARPDGSWKHPVRHWLALLGATTVIGLVVVLANVAQAIVILDNATGLITAPDSANKVSSILALLPPTLSAAAALLYAVTRLRVSGDEIQPADG